MQPEGRVRTLSCGSEDRCSEPIVMLQTEDTEQYVQKREMYYPTSEGVRMENNPGSYARYSTYIVLSPEWIVNTPGGIQTHLQRYLLSYRPS